MFLHNMRALWRHDPKLALRIDAIGDEERIPLTPTRSGAWTAKVATPEGQTVYLHSRYDPEAEAQRFAASVEIEDKFCFVVSGIGLGYHVLALFERLRGDAFILAAEPSLPLISTALTCVDFTDLITSERFIILTDDDKAHLHERIKPHETLIMLGAQFVRHGPSIRIAEEGHAAITKVIAEFVTFERMTLLTLLQNARITCKNIAMNLVTYVTTPPIDILRKRFAGDPVVVISAGPSLTRTIDQLADLKGKAVLIAVQTALGPLLRRGIIPDFVTSLDFHKMSLKFFEGVEGLDDVHLVAEPKATWHVVDGYPGPVSLLDSAWARLVIGDALGSRGGLQSGATVAHLAFYLAAHMGCDPIIFVGQDLAFTGHVFYVPGVEIHRSWRGEINRFNTMERKEWERIVRNRPILLKVPGTDGGELYTDELLFAYLEQFEKDIAAVPCKVINATGGGARIRGTGAMPLPEAVKRYCQEPIDPKRFAYRDTTRWRDPSKLAPAKRELQKRIEELDEVESVCEELIELLGELEGLTGDPHRFNRRLVRVDELRAKINQKSRTYEMVNAATQMAELRRYSADRRIGAVETEDAERAKRQIVRDTEFITAVRDGAVDVKKMLDEALQRITDAAEKA